MGTNPENKAEKNDFNFNETLSNMAKDFSNKFSNFQNSVGEVIKGVKHEANESNFNKTLGTMADNFSTQINDFKNYFGQVYGDIFHKKEEKPAEKVEEKQIEIKEIKAVKIEVISDEKKVEEKSQPKPEEIKKVEDNKPEPKQEEIKKIEEVKPEPKQEKPVKTEYLSKKVCDLKIEINQRREVYKLLLTEMKSTYDLSVFPDEVILSAIENAKGNRDDVFLYLFA